MVGGGQEAAKGKAPRRKGQADSPGNVCLSLLLPLGVWGEEAASGASTFPDQKGTESATQFWWTDSSGSLRSTGPGQVLVVDMVRHLKAGLQNASKGGEHQRVNFILIPRFFNISEPAPARPSLYQVPLTRRPCSHYLPKNKQTKCIKKFS